jgi:hypothetical protein
MPRGLQVGGLDLVRLLPLILILAALVVSLVRGRHASGPEPEDPEHGGGSGPARPLAPRPPGGGLPLGVATQARIRLRGHERPADRIPGRAARRPAREPDRDPAPTGS